MKNHYFCLNCGYQFPEPYKFQSCDPCNQEYRIGMKYSECKRCRKAKEYNKYGLCLKCYKIVQKQEEKAQARAASGG